MRFDWQLRILLILGIVCIAVIALLDFRVADAIFAFVFSLLLIFVGQKLYADDTAANWLNFSFLDTGKRILGGALMPIGWFLFLRGVLALAIASIFLRSE